MTVTQSMTKTFTFNLASGDSITKVSIEGCTHTHTHTHTHTYNSKESREHQKILTFDKNFDFFISFRMFKYIYIYSQNIYIIKLQGEVET